MFYLAKHVGPDVISSVETESKRRVSTANELGPNVLINVKIVLIVALLDVNL